MKTPRFFYSILAGGLVLGSIALWPHSGGAAISTNGPVAGGGKAGTTSAAATNSTTTNSVLPIPVSVFNTDISPVKDPFFPNTLRVPKRNEKGPKEAPGISPTAFHLMALSGSTEERLAMINHRTLSVGESVEVPIPDHRKATIRLLQIKEKSVIIRVTKPPQPDLIELSLSKGAQ